MDGSVDDAGTDRYINRWMGGCVDGRTNECMNRWLNDWIDERMMNM